MICGFKKTTTRPATDEAMNVLNIILDEPFILGVYIDRVLPPLKKSQPIQLIKVPKNV